MNSFTIELTVGCYLTYQQNGTLTALLWLGSQCRDQGYLPTYGLHHTPSPVPGTYTLDLNRYMYCVLTHTVCRVE